MGDPVILTNAFLAVGTGTASADRNLSNRLRSLSWSVEYEDHDVTVMGSQTRLHALGLGDANLNGELLMAYTTGDGGENIDNLFNTLQDLSASGQSFLVTMRAVNAARNATNPEYSMTAKLSKRNIIDGEIGAVLMTPFTFLAAGPVSRTTASS